jgi:multiple sugar transport system permease protein
MGRGKASDNLAALPLVAPFVIVYLALFIYPSLQMIATSFTSSSLTLPGSWVGLDNYATLIGDKVFGLAIRNTLFFVLLTVVPGTLVGLGLAMVVSRLKGWWQALALAAFFLPYVLPVSTISSIAWALTNPMMDGPLSQIFIRGGNPVPIWYNVPTFLPAVAVLTIWWTAGFNVLVFLAGLKALPQELYDAAKIDGAGRWRSFTAVTWPLIWPVTTVVVTIQLIAQFKVFDQVYLMAANEQAAKSMVLVQYVYTAAFQRNEAGYASSVAVGLFVIVLTLSALQFQLTRIRSAK